MLMILYILKLCFLSFDGFDDSDGVDDDDDDDNKNDDDADDDDDDDNHYITTCQKFKAGTSKITNHNRLINHVITRQAEKPVNNWHSPSFLSQSRSTHQNLQLKKKRRQKNSLIGSSGKMRRSHFRVCSHFKNKADTRPIFVNDGQGH